MPENHIALQEKLQHLHWFLAAILDEPNRDDLRFALADWYSDPEKSGPLHDQKKAELIRTQCYLANLGLFMDPKICAVTGKTWGELEATIERLFLEGEYHSHRPQKGRGMKDEHEFLENKYLNGDRKDFRPEFDFSIVRGIPQVTFVIEQLDYRKVTKEQITKIMKDLPAAFTLEFRGMKFNGFQVPESCNANIRFVSCEKIGKLAFPEGYQGSFNVFHSAKPTAITFGNKVRIDTAGVQARTVVKNIVAKVRTGEIPNLESFDYLSYRADRAELNQERREGIAERSSGKGAAGKKTTEPPSKWTGRIGDEREPRITDPLGVKSRGNRGKDSGHTI